jgi:hypothetical protein
MKRKQKPRMRIPLPRKGPGGVHKSKKQYSRKAKHKKPISPDKD